MQSTPSQNEDFGIVTARFDPGHYTCMENVGTVYTTVVVSRAGIYEPCVVEVDYRTVDGSANAVTDYLPSEGTLTFYPNEDRKHIGIEIVDNDIYEEDEHFCVHLENLRAVPAEGKKEQLPSQLKTPFVATVLIVDNDHAGAFGFENEKEEVYESIGEFKLKVVRTRGARGQVSVHYKTVEGTAKSGEDFIEQEGTLYFDDEQPDATISIPIINDDSYEKKEWFFVELSEPVWENTPDLGTLSPDGATTKTEADIANEGRPILAPISKCKVEIIESKEFKGFVDRMLSTANTSLVVGTKSWKEQFTDALSVDAGGDDDDEEEVEPRCFDYVMHALTLPWKLLFALVPPTDYFGGWLCFVASIVMIGLMTALIGDLASHFGCTVGLKDSVTSISIVALGTSLPDTFASKTAALQDSHADACIVNVTGSNAVNVFLGIGIAWAMAAIYHAAVLGDKFQVDKGDLGFSVTLFCVGAVVCIIILQIRRYAKPVLDYFGGWLCFVASIVMIGLMTALIGDLASHFGCTVGLKDSVTSISIVALGTSLPDTFASKTAALQDSHADACIVNVTGSNAVNVFLGIGIAWAMAAIYHAAVLGDKFQVDKGDLGFSVTLFCVGAVVCIIILQIRRYAKPVLGELGGRFDAKVLTFVIFIAIWLTYVILSSLNAYCVIEAGF